MKNIIVDGPFDTLMSACNVAYLSVDEDATMWCVIEVFGEGFSHPGPNGDMYGKLYVCEESHMWEACQKVGGEDYQIIDTYGYDKTQI